MVGHPKSDFTELFGAESSAQLQPLRSYHLQHISLWLVLLGMISLRDQKSKAAPIMSLSMLWKRLVVVPKF